MNAPATTDSITDDQIREMLAEEENGRRRPFALEVLTAALQPEGAALRISREPARGLCARTWNCRNGGK